MTETTTLRVPVQCACGHEGHAHPSRATRWRCAACRPGTEPEPVTVHWPTLVTLAERRGIPVSRVDEHGAVQIIRTTRQLAQEWE